jgi:hypothetical protein
VVDASMEPLWQEIESETQALYERVAGASRAFFGRNPTYAERIAWLHERVWSERMGTKVHAMAVVHYADLLDPDLLHLLSVQVGDEARHHRLLSACLTARGQDPTAYEPRQQWKDHFQKEVRAAEVRDPLVLFAIMHMAGEGPASAGAHVASDVLRGTDFSDVAEAYVSIGRDETRHLDIGREALRRYAKTPADLQKVLAAMRADADSIVVGYRKYV